MLGDPVAEDHDDEPGQHAHDGPSEPADNGGEHSTTIVRVQPNEDGAEARSDPAAIRTAQDNHSIVDRIELTDRCFQENNPAAHIYRAMLDDREHPHAAHWTASHDQLVAAYVFQTSSPAEQRQRLSDARANPTYAANQGREAISLFFTVFTMGGVITQCEGRQDTYCLSGPGRKLAKASASSN